MMNANDFNPHGIEKFEEFLNDLHALVGSSSNSNLTSTVPFQPDDQNLSFNQIRNVSSQVCSEIPPQPEDKNQNSCSKVSSTVENDGLLANSEEDMLDPAISYEQLEKELFMQRIQKLSENELCLDVKEELEEHSPFYYESQEPQVIGALRMSSFKDSMDDVVVKEELNQDNSPARSPQPSGDMEKDNASIPDLFMSMQMDAANSFEAQTAADTLVDLVNNGFSIIENEERIEEQDHVVDEDENKDEDKRETECKEDIKKKSEKDDLEKSETIKQNKIENTKDKQVSSTSTMKKNLSTKKSKLSPKVNVSSEKVKTSETNIKNGEKTKSVEKKIEDDTIKKSESIKLPNMPTLTTNIVYNKPTVKTPVLPKGPTKTNQVVAIKPKKVTRSAEDLKKQELEKSKLSGNIALFPDISQIGKIPKLKKPINNENKLNDNQSRITQTPSKSNNTISKTIIEKSKIDKKGKTLKDHEKKLVRDNKSDYKQAWDNEDWLEFAEIVDEACFVDEKQTKNLKESKSKDDHGTNYGRNEYKRSKSRDTSRRRSRSRSVDKYRRSEDKYRRSRSVDKHKISSRSSDKYRKRSRSTDKSKDTKTPDKYSQQLKRIDKSIKSKDENKYPEIYNEKRDKISEDCNMAVKDTGKYDYSREVKKEKSFKNIDAVNLGSRSKSRELNSNYLDYKRKTESSSVRKSFGDKNDKQWKHMEKESPKSPDFNTNNTRPVDSNTSNHNNYVDKHESTRCKRSRSTSKSRDTRRQSNPLSRQENGHRHRSRSLTRNDYVSKTNHRESPSFWKKRKRSQSFDKNDKCFKSHSELDPRFSRSPGPSRSLKLSKDSRKRANDEPTDPLLTSMKPVNSRPLLDIQIQDESQVKDILCVLEVFSQGLIAYKRKQYSIDLKRNFDQILKHELNM